MPSTPIRVKLIARGRSSDPWGAQTAGGSGKWGDCQFLFDRDEDSYDWLVVIDDVSRRLRSAPERLACADEHTILVTTEPPTITRYGKGFCSQFHHVITSQEESALPHPRRYHGATGNLWFHGRTLDELIAGESPMKDRMLSTVCSAKQQKHTVHHARFEFTQWLRGKCDRLEIYGHGVRFVEKKYDSLDRYRFHLAIENHVALHHWTEKFADPVLSHCIPIYHGCPNLGDYFPEDSYVAFDIHDREAALDRIRGVLEDPDAYEKRREALLEARRLVLERYNLLAILAEHIRRHHRPGQQASRRPLYGRKQMRVKHPGDLISHLQWAASHTLASLSARSS